MRYSPAGLFPKAVALKPQDVAVVLAMVLLENQAKRLQEPTAGTDKERTAFSSAPWTLTRLASETCLSLGEIHNVLHRLTATRLIRAEDRRVRRRALEEFLLHGIQYAFPAVRGEAVRGCPTAYAAPQLRERFLVPDVEIPVWPHPSGTVRGIALLPLYEKAPDAATQSPDFYNLLAVVDLLRGDFRARERTVAADLLKICLNESISLSENPA